MSPHWSDWERLSDGELTLRLEQRGVPRGEARWLVSHRDFMEERADIERELSR